MDPSDPSAVVAPSPTGRTTDAPGRRSVLAGAALGLTTLALPRAAVAASVATSAVTTYTAVEDGGRPYVWGWGFAPEALGTGVTGELLEPRLMTGGAGDFATAELVKVQPAYWASLALAAGGSMYAWGRGNNGTIASTTTTADATVIASWLDADGTTSIATPTIVDFTPSQAAVVAVGADGHVYAWGGQWGGEAGLPADLTIYATPRRVTATLGLSGTVGTEDPEDRIVQVSGNNRLVVWLDGKGQVRTSGTQDSFLPQLGRGTGTYVSTTAGLVAGSLANTAGTATRVVQVAAGFAFVLALGRDGRIHAWGANGYGNLGDGTTTTRYDPVVINGATDSALPAADAAGRIIQVSAGSQHALALGLDGRVYTWGSGADGRLGNNATTDQPVPIDITGSGALPAAGAVGRIVQVAAGHETSYALGSDGAVYAWGAGSRGQLGNGGTADSLVPVRISDRGAFAPLAPNATGTQRRIVLLGVHRGAREVTHVIAIDNLSAAA